MADPSSPMRGRPAGLIASSARTPTKPRMRPSTPPGHAEHHAFGEQLAHDARTFRAKRGADGEFALPSGGAHQQQVGDVGAGNQQDESHGAQQNEQRLAGVSDNRVAQRLNSESTLLICLRKRAQILLPCQLHLRVGLGHRHAGLEHRRGLEEMTLVGAVGLELEGDTDFGIGVGNEISPQHADDRVGLIPQRQRLADNVLTAAELALPQAVTRAPPHGRRWVCPPGV